MAAAALPMAGHDPQQLNQQRAATKGVDQAPTRAQHREVNHQVEKEHLQRDGTQINDQREALGEGINQIITSSNRSRFR